MRIVKKIVLFAVAIIAPMIVSAPVVIFAAFFLLRIAQNGKMKGDAAIAIISTSALSIWKALANNSTSILAFTSGLTNITTSSGLQNVFTPCLL